MTTCSGCGKSWSGHSAQHCKVSGCHETFSGTTAGDMHRVGIHTTLLLPVGRRCLSVAEMEGIGMVLNSRGVWTSGGSFPTDDARTRWAESRDA